MIFPDSSNPYAYNASFLAEALHHYTKSYRRKPSGMALEAIQTAELHLIIMTILGPDKASVEALKREVAYLRKLHIRRNNLPSNWYFPG